MTTLTTVGYGDISPTSEGGALLLMVFGIVLLFIGVATFAVLSGQLTSIILEFNASEQEKKGKLDIVTELNSKF